MIAAGGTAGHVVPAIAVADALRDSGAPRSASSARASAPRPNWCPRPATRSTSSGQRPRPPQPAQGRSPRRAGRGARCRRGAGACCASAGPTSCSAAAATSPGPVGLAASRLGMPLVLTEADSHLGLDQPPARPPGASASASPSRSPGARASPTWSPGGPCRARCSRRTAAAARRRFAIPEGDRCVAVFGGSLGAAQRQPGGVRGVRRARRRGAEHAGRPWVLHVDRAPRLRRAARALGASRAAGALPAARVRAARWATCWPPPTWSSPGPAGR